MQSTKSANLICHIRFLPLGQLNGQCDQTLPLSAKGVACETTSYHGPLPFPSSKPPLHHPNSTSHPFFIPNTYRSLLLAVLKAKHHFLSSNSSLSIIEVTQ